MMLTWTDRTLRRLLQILIVGYQRAISPWLPPACRHKPTCSEYARQAFQIHASPKALLLIVRRLWHCQPLYPGGYDPVPPRGRWPRTGPRYQQGKRNSAPAPQESAGPSTPSSETGSRVA